MSVPHKKKKTGIVVSDKMDKTIVVKVVGMKKHPSYRKIVKTVKKFYVHDEQNLSKIGDVVTIVETRPLSRLKRWILQSKTEKKA